MKEKLIAFIFGDLFVTAHIILAGIIHDFGGFMMKVLGTLIIGAAGGVAGMIGKESYPWLKKTFKKIFKNERNKKSKI